jgi:hypothetical protein
MKQEPTQLSENKQWRSLQGDTKVQFSEEKVRGRATVRPVGAVLPAACPAFPEVCRREAQQREPAERTEATACLCGRSLPRPSRGALSTPYRMVLGGAKSFVFGTRRIQPAESYSIHETTVVFRQLIERKGWRHFLLATKFNFSEARASRREEVSILGAFCVSAVKLRRLRHEGTP